MDAARRKWLLRGFRLGTIVAASVAASAWMRGSRRREPHLIVLNFHPLCAATLLAGFPRSDSPTFAEELGRASFHTGAFLADSARAGGIASDWQRSVERFEDALGALDGGRKLFDHVRFWLQQVARSRRPIFLLVDAHALPPQDRPGLAAALVLALDRHGYGDTSNLAVIAPHGPGQTPTSAITAVSIAMSFPGDAGAVPGREAQGRIMDIAPTLLDALQLAPTRSIPGQSLLPALRSGRSPAGPEERMPRFGTP